MHTQHTYLIAEGLCETRAVKSALFLIQGHVMVAMRFSIIATVADIVCFTVAVLSLI